MKKLLLSAVLCMTLFASACQGQTVTEVDTDETIMEEDTEESTETDAQPVSETPTETPSPAEFTDVVSTDGRYHLQMPQGWTESTDRQSERMVLEIQGPSDDQYAGFLVVDKATLGDMDIATYMDRYGEGAAQRFEGAQIGQKQQIQVNGFQAYHMTITGTVEGTSYVNWVYAIDATEAVYIATGSAYPVNSRTAETSFNGMVNSFGLVEG